MKVTILQIFAFCIISLVRCDNDDSNTRRNTEKCFGPFFPWKHSKHSFSGPDGPPWNRGPKPDERMPDEPMRDEPMSGESRPMPGGPRPMPGGPRPMPGGPRPMPGGPRPMHGRPIRFMPGKLRMFPFLPLPQECHVYFLPILCETRDTMANDTNISETCLENRPTCEDCIFDSLEKVAKLKNGAPPACIEKIMRVLSGCNYETTFAPVYGTTGTYESRSYSTDSQSEYQSTPYPYQTTTYEPRSSSTGSQNEAQTNEYPYETTPCESSSSTGSPNEAESDTYSYEATTSETRSSSDDSQSEAY